MDEVSQDTVSKNNVSVEVSVQSSIQQSDTKCSVIVQCVGGGNVTGQSATERNAFEQKKLREASC